MSARTRPVLRLDDPLAPTGQAAAAPTHHGNGNSASAARRDGPGRTRQSVAAGSAPDAASAADHPAPSASMWRDWDGAEKVATFRLPTGLLDELAERAGRQSLPLGLTVAAALAHLLDQDDERLAALVDRADDARHLARQRARRRAP